MSIVPATINNQYNSDLQLTSQSSPLIDSLSCIDWSKNMKNFFACTAWDGSLKIFQVCEGQGLFAIQQKACFFVPNGMPLTTCCWNQDSSILCVGAIDGAIRCLDTNSGQFYDIGMHKSQQPLNHMSFLNQNVLLTTAYDTDVNFWQVGTVQGPIKSIELPKKVYKADCNKNMFCAGMCQERIAVINLDNFQSRTEIDSADLGKGSPIQSISVRYDGKSLGIGSIDGRANISGLQLSANKINYTTKSFITFKGHKQDQGGNAILYPINSVDFNIRNDKWFLTAGSDGYMHFWDYEQKNKIKSLNYAKVPICVAKVDYAGQMIAYGLGNDWHIGKEGDKWKPKLGVHRIGQGQVKFMKT